MSWRGENGGIAAALQGHVIITPCQSMYFPWRQGDLKVETVGGGSITIIKKTYSYVPVPDTLITIHNENFIKGV